MFNIHNAGTLCEEYIKELNLKTEHPELSLKSMPFLSDRLWLRKKKLMILGARPSNGKSAFAIQMAVDFALQDKTVLFCSLEMENLECFERMITNINRINNFDLRCSVGQKHIPAIQASAELLKTKKLLITDCIGSTWKQIDDLVLEATKVKPSPIDVVFIDYIQNTKEPAKNQKEGFDEYIKHIREMAIRHNFLAVVISQINRISQDSRDKKPYLHQLKGTGVLEEHSDYALLLHYPRFYDKTKTSDEFHLYLDKNKLGLTCHMEITYMPECNLFIEKKPNQKPGVVSKNYQDTDNEIPNWED